MVGVLPLASPHRHVQQLGARPPRKADAAPGGAGRIGSPAGRGRIGSPAGRGRIGTRGEAGRQQKLNGDKEKENTFSYVNNKEVAAGAGHAETGAGLGSQIPMDR